MTAEQIAAVESASGIALPPRYRDFLLHFPPGLFRPEAAEGDDWDWLQADHLMFHTATSLIEYNRSVRRPGELLINACTEPWPDEYLIIGDDASGDYWCVRLDESGEMVHQFAHEEGFFRPLHRTLGQHAEWLESSR